MKRLAAALAAVAVSLLTSGSMAWGSETIPTPTYSETPTPTPSASVEPIPVEVAMPDLVTTCPDAVGVVIPDIEGASWYFNDRLVIDSVGELNAIALEGSPQEVWRFTVTPIADEGYTLIGGPGDSQRRAWTYGGIASDTCADWFAEIEPTPSPTPSPTVLPVGSHAEQLPQLADTGWTNDLAVGALVAIVAGVLLLILTPRRKR